jgi:SAM-dependent methyltransferase
MNYSKSDFQKLWGNKGYTESFWDNLHQKLPELIQQNAVPNGVALEIGCGSCYWTRNWLVPRFKSVVALDVITAPEYLVPAIRYVQVEDRDFSCSSIESNSIVFVYSFGCFCHLSNSANLAYLYAIYRILKTGGKALLAFANWPRYKNLAPLAEKAKIENRESPNASDWFYNDAETVTQMAAQSGFGTYVDAIPGCRDLVALFSKLPT